MDFLYSNSGGDTYVYGNYHKLEAKRDGLWRVLPNKGEAYEDIAHGIRPYSEPRPNVNDFEGPFRFPLTGRAVAARCRQMNIPRKR